MAMTDQQRDAARELERLGDLGRGSFGFADSGGAIRPFTENEWLGLVADGWFVVSVPQMALAFLSLPPVVNAAVLCLTALSVGLCAVTVFRAPELSVWHRQLWLASKMLTITLALTAVAALLLAGLWGLYVAVPLAPVVLILAGGTALLRRGHLVGAVPAVMSFTLTGLVFLCWIHGVAADQYAAEITGIAGVCAAALLGVLVVLESDDRGSAGERARRRRVAR